MLRDEAFPGTVDELTDEQVAAIVLAGAEIGRDFDFARTGSATTPPARSLQTAIAAWQRSDDWRACKAKTLEGYGYSIKKIQAWSERLGHPDPTTLTRTGIEKFLAEFNDRPTTKRQLLKALRIVMDHVVALGWRADNPCAKLKVKVPRTKAVIWEQADVDLYVRIARQGSVRLDVGKSENVRAGAVQALEQFGAVSIKENRGGDVLTLDFDGTEIPTDRVTDTCDRLVSDGGVVSYRLNPPMHSIALIILLEWEIGQRLTDVRQFRQGMEYDRGLGVFSFEQSKTDEPVTIEISAMLRALLNEALGNQLFLFRNERTGKAYTENRLSQTFKWVRVAAIKAGGRALLLRQLRHSCIVQLARVGCTVPEIASITGHSLSSVHSILSTYLPRDSIVARNAQVKRGIVVEAAG